MFVCVGVCVCVCLAGGNVLEIFALGKRFK